MGSLIGFRGGRGSLFSHFDGQMCLPLVLSVVLKPPHLKLHPYSRQKSTGAKAVFSFWLSYLYVLQCSGVLSELCRCVDKEGAGVFLFFFFAIDLLDLVDPLAEACSGDGTEGILNKS